MLLDLPSTRAEAWRWSDLSALPELATRTPAGTAPHELPWIDCDGEGPRLLFIDGRLDAARSRPGPIEIAALDGEAAHPLARHAAGAGWRLRLGRDHAPAGLIQIVHVATGGGHHVPAEVELDVDAQASIVETFIGDGWANGFTRFKLFKGARLMLARRLIGSGGFVSLTDRATVGEGASFTLATLAAGGADSRIEGLIEMAGDAAFAEAGGALLARGNGRHDANFALRHQALAGMSRQIWRAVANDTATCAIAARVEVARGAQKTDGEQSLKGLLLERGPTLNLKPELEIFADDVKCAHGATVGELDRNALFYLASRGVPLAEAKALLTRAFVAAAIDRIGEAAVREAFEADAAAWLAGVR